MIYKFFANFPTINYEKVNIRDLTRRVALSKSLRRIPTIFHPYELKDNMRADTLAYMYYKDPEADWLIYLTNGIVDPYYGWYLEEEEFFSYIVDKYGTYEEPQQRVFFWQTNWVDDDIHIEPPGYEAMNAEHQKYWTPVYGQTSVLSYRRRREDWRMNTNRIIDVTIDDTSDFEKGELVVAYKDGQYVGRAEVDAIVSSTRLFLYHVQDNWEVGSEIRHRNLNVQTLGSSENTGPEIEAVKVVYENITDEESTYWEPIYYFDYERMINESRKIVMLLDANYLHEAFSGFKQKVNE